jgi:hypothetical protein
MLQFLYKCINLQYNETVIYSLGKYHGRMFYIFRNAATYGKQRLPFGLKQPMKAEYSPLSSHKPQFAVGCKHFNQHYL